MTRPSPWRLSPRIPCSGRSSRRHTARGALAVALASGGLGVFAPSNAHAHFKLLEPPSFMSQTSDGSPQKLGPCGDEAVTPAATATGIVTTFQEGQTITLTVDGTIPHPGHWRVSLGLTGPNDLPAEPAVTPGTFSGVQMACGTAVIENPPVFPVLGDNLLPSTTTGFTGNMNMQVTLPKGVTCTNCTLQVIQFMSDHGLNNPGGCFYHHCATISIVAASSDGGTIATGTSSAASTSTSGAGAGTTGASASATSSSVGATGSSAGATGASVASSSVGATGSGAGVTGSGAGATGSGAGVTGSGGGATAGNSGAGGASEGTGGASSGGATSPASGCGCSVPGPSTPAFFGLAGLLGLAALVRRRRRR